ncbi:MAG: OsmC family protein [Flavisolibacter sp.]
MDKTKIIASAEAINKGEVLTTKLFAEQFEHVADEPEVYGGMNEGAAPAQYLCMALASCKAITLRMYAKRKKWLLAEIQVKVNMVKGDQMASGFNTFFCSIKLVGELNKEQEKRLMEISKICPVDRLLNKPNEVVTIID